MPFRQRNLDKSINQSRGIFDKFIYSTDDDVATVLAQGYFDESRFASDPDWQGAVIECLCSDGFITARIDSGALSVEYNSVSSLNNRIAVTSPSDLAGTLDPTKEYFIDGIIDMTGSGVEPVVPAGGIQLSGYSFDNSKLICSDDNYTLFSSPAGGSGNVNGKDFAIEITGANSQVYDLISNTGFNSFEFYKVNYNDCTSLGTIHNYRQGLETGTGRFGGTPELTLSGTWVGGYFIDNSIVRGLDAGFSGSLYKAGAGFSMGSRFRSNQNIDLPALASFFDFQSSNFVNASTIELDFCIVTRDGSFDATDSNITPNISSDDLKCKWSGNTGMPNTFEGGRAAITAEVVTTGVSSFTPLLGTYTNSDLQHFDSPANGQLRHLGASPREYTMTIELSLASTQNNQLEIRVQKFDASTSTTSTVFGAVRSVNALAGATDRAFFTVIDNVDIDEGDYVYIEARNNTGNNDITAELGSLFFLEAR